MDRGRRTIFAVEAGVANYCLGMVNASSEYKANRPAFYQFFCASTHPNIALSPDAV
jgi:hypothetical protein